MRRPVFESDHEYFRESVAAFVDREVLPRHEQMIAERAMPRAVWLEAGRQGFLGLQVPEIYGGAGIADFRFNAVLGEELAKVSAALASCFGIHVDIVAPYLIQLATPEFREQWLREFCSGEALTAIAMTEPSAGSDLAGIRSTARQSGDGWVLNGTKTFITNGGSADLFIVAAKTAPDKGARGISLFAVPASADGFSRGRKLDKVGQPEADTAELAFNDVEIGAEQLIGELNGGFRHMMGFLSQERLSCALANVSHVRKILDETIDYAKGRQAFGSPIGSMQHNKFLLAELETKVNVAQTFVDAALAAHVAGTITAIDAAKAKWWSAHVQNDVLDHCVQLHGGYGYMNEYRVARAWQDARVTKIWAGSNEIMKELIGRDLGL